MSLTVALLKKEDGTVHTMIDSTFVLLHLCIVTTSSQHAPVQSVDGKAIKRRQSRQESKKQMYLTMIPQKSLLPHNPQACVFRRPQTRHGITFDQETRGSGPSPCASLIVIFQVKTCGSELNRPCEG